MNRNINQESISITTVIIMTFFAMMFVASFNSLLPALDTIGFLTVFSLLTIASFLYLIHISRKKEIHKIHFYILIPFVMLTSTMIIGAYISRSTASFQYIFQFSTIILFFLFLSLIKWDEKKIRLAKWLSIMLFVIVLPIIADIGLIGAYMTLPIFLILLERKKSIINLLFLIASLYLMYLAGMRAVFLLISFALITYIIWNFISKNKIRFTLFFFTVIAGLLSFVFVYPKLIYWSKFPVIENFVYEYTGKSLMSGRNRIWEDLTYLINTKPYFGHGTSVLPRQFLDSNLSAHNLYLQTALQNGWIGLSLLMLLFLAIWFGYYHTKNLYPTRLSASFFIGILVYQSFEVVLTQNKMDTAFILWFIISVGISYSLFYKKKQLE